MTKKVNNYFIYLSTNYIFTMIFEDFMAMFSVTFLQGAAV